MGLNAITGIGPATVKKLNAAGVRTLDDMRQMNVAQVAEKTGVAEGRLREWKTEAKLIKVLDDIRGIGPSTKKKLHAAGIHSVDDMAKAAIHEVAHATRITQERLKQWQTQARRLAKQAESYVEREAPKVKAASRKVAKKAQETSVVARREAARVATKAKETSVVARREALKAAEQAKATGETLTKEVQERVEAFKDETPVPGSNGASAQKPTFVARFKRLFAARPPQ